LIWATITLIKLGWCKQGETMNIGWLEIVLITIGALIIYVIYTNDQDEERGNRTKLTTTCFLIKIKDKFIISTQFSTHILLLFTNFILNTHYLWRLKMDMKN
jgi:hypothetical protein